MKKIKVLISILLTTIVLTGCNNAKQMTYVIDEDASASLRLDLSDEYDINDKSPFTITKDEKDVCSGIFINAATYNNYMVAISKDAKTTILDQGHKDGIDYIFYEYKSSKTEYNYLIKYKKNGIGLILRNNISEESVNDCFKHLKF